MNEIAEKLRDLTVETAFPLALPEIEDVVDVQEELLIHIPTAFRDYLLSCSDVIYGTYEPVTIADSSSHTYLPEMAAEAWEQGLPRDLIPLCQQHNGYYAIAQDDSVFFWHSSSDEVEEISEDIWSWVRDVWLKAN